MSIDGYFDSVCKANEENIRNHLICCDEKFSPRLSDRVDLYEYSKKIFQNAVTFEIWIENELVGLVAAYFNDPIAHTAYITSVSVSKAHLGRGLAKKMVNMCLKYAVKNNYHRILLEVFKSNLPAISLYKQFGFFESEDRGAKILMELNLTQEGFLDD